MLASCIVVIAGGHGVGTLLTYLLLPAFSSYRDATLISIAIHAIGIVSWGLLVGAVIVPSARRSRVLYALGIIELWIACLLAVMQSEWPLGSILSAIPLGIIGAIGFAWSQPLSSETK